MEGVTKSYMMLLNIAKPVPEHVKIKTILNEISPDSKAVYFDKHGGAFLFNTSLALRLVVARFDRVFQGDDRFLIVEIGPNWHTYGNNVAARWLRHHLGKGEEK
jgi:hypothetical protein